MICPRCGKDNPQGARFCMNCRYLLESEEDFQGDEKNSNLAKVIIGVEAVLLIALAVLFGVIGNSMTKPEKILENYWEAREEGDWNRVYDCLDVSDSEFLTRQMFVNAMRNRAGVDSWSMEGESEEGETKGFTVIYEDTAWDSGKPQEQVTTLVSKGRNWLFFQNWRVTVEDLTVRDVTFYLPVGSQLELNGQEVSMEGVSDENGTIELQVPQLFSGDYQIKVKKEGMETYQTNLTLGTDDQGFEYEVILRPSKKLETELVERSGAALQMILQNALSGKDFGTVSELFSETAIESGEVSEQYNEIKDIRSDGRIEEVTFFEIYELEGELSPDQTGVAGQVFMEMEGQGKKHYVSEFMGVLSQDISEGNLKLSFDFVEENGQWRLNSMPITEEDIRYI